MLNWSTFESTFVKYFLPAVEKRFDRAFVDSFLLHSAYSEDEVDQLDDISQTLTSKYNSGSKKIPNDIVKVFKSKDALKNTKANLNGDLLHDFTDNNLRLQLIKELKVLYRYDYAVPTETKEHWDSLANNSTLPDFLGEILIYSVLHQESPSANAKTQFPHTNLPLRKKYFIGRDKELSLIESNFRDGACLQIIYGMSGTGKSELAVQYAYEFYAAYDTVWMIDCSSDYYREKDIDIFLKMVNYDGSFRDYLETHNEYLIILDGINYINKDQYARLTSLLPRNPDKGHILITTQTDLELPFEAIPRIHLSEMPLEVAVDFLTVRVGSPDDGTYTEIAEELGFLPLALEYAGAYMTALKLSGRQYIWRLKHYGRQELLNNDFGILDARLQSVYRAFSLTIERMLEEAKTNKLVDTALTFLIHWVAETADNTVPRIRFEILNYQRKLNQNEEYVDLFAKNFIDEISCDEFLFDDVIACLRTYSLINISETDISLHKLLAETILCMSENEFFKERISSRFNDKISTYEDLRLLANSDSITPKKAFRISNHDDFDTVKYHLREMAVACFTIAVDHEKDVNFFPNDDLYFTNSSWKEYAYLMIYLASELGKNEILQSMKPYVTDPDMANKWLTRDMYFSFVTLGSYFAYSVLNQCASDCPRILPGNKSSDEFIMETFIDGIIQESVCYLETIPLSDTLINTLGVEEIYSDTEDVKDLRTLNQKQRNALIYRIKAIFKCLDKINIVPESSYRDLKERFGKIKM